jgi:N6-adenosine-specific RNA methylase IME4
VIGQYKVTNMATTISLVAENTKNFYVPHDDTKSLDKPSSVDFEVANPLGGGAVPACERAPDRLAGGGAVAKLYEVIYADPPWRYDFAKVKKDSIEAHYPTMAIDEICRLRFPVAKDAVLYLWTTAPKLKEGLRVMKAWGFTYKTQIIWNKDRKGYGYWAMSSHEILLIGTRGHFSPPPTALRIKSVFTQKKKSHSQKPSDIRDLIRSWFPNANRLELFAREATDGWDSWGDEAPTSVDCVAIAPPPTLTESLTAFLDTMPWMSLSAGGTPDRESGGTKKGKKKRKRPNLSQLFRAALGGNSFPQCTAMAQGAKACPSQAPGRGDCYRPADSGAP